MKTVPYRKFAEVYDELMNQQEFYESYYLFVLEVLNGRKPSAILDLGCGTGKLAKLFRDNGYRIEGLDTSKDMLKIARKRGIKAYHKSMAGFKLNRRYSLVLSIFDSLNYLRTAAELRSCFRSVHNHLTTGGLFIFDMNSDYKINSIIPLFGRTAQYIVGGTKVIWSNSHIPDRWIAELQLTSSGRTYFERHAETAFSLQDTEKLLKKSGFEIIRAVSDFEFSPISRTSLKWFFVCRKL